MTIPSLDTRGHDLSTRESAHLSNTPPQPARRKGTAHTAGAKEPEWVEEKEKQGGKGREDLKPNAMG